jgi:hypothetical protein
LINVFDNISTFIMKPIDEIVPENEKLFFGEKPFFIKSTNNNNHVPSIVTKNGALYANRYCNSDTHHFMIST